jgi:GTP-binding protein HflX
MTSSFINHPSSLRQRAVAVTLEQRNADWEESLQELTALADTAGAETVGIFTQKREAPDPQYFLGKGRAHELRQVVAEAEADLVLVDNELSPGQQDHLEQITKVDVVDRTGLILDIFAQHAHSNEGKLQVELAQLTYRLPRLVGRGRELSRLGGGIGTRGPGETKLESDRRRLRRRIGILKKQVEKLSKQRAQQRRSRGKAELPVACLVGYTNTGKSTLLNALCDADVLVEDRLFATLDPTIRRLELPGGRHVLLSDTVGFIRSLPHQLIAAFRATLEEVQEAEILVHVLDASSPNLAGQREAAERVLGELGCATKPTLLVYNKADKAKNLEFIEKMAAREPRAVVVSALRGRGLDSLRFALSRLLEEGLMEVSALLPMESADLVSLAHERGEVLSEEYRTDGIQLHARVPSDLAARIRARAQGNNEVSVEAETL